MKKQNYPFIALALGLTLLLIVIYGNQINNAGTPAVPLLTLLVVNEFGFFATAIGSYIGIRHIMATGMKPIYTITTGCCLLLSIYFMFMGIALWPQ
ncbi:MAG: hypothetical protein ABW162_06725 [Candidatus Sedimenticola sp. PURPLELP]